MTINQTPSPNSATPTRARAGCTLTPCAHPCTRLESCIKCHDITHGHNGGMSTHLAQPSEFRTRYRLGAPGTTVIHLSARDFTDLGLTPGARTIHLFGATFTRLETI